MQFVGAMLSAARTGGNPNYQPRYLDELEVASGWIQSAQLHGNMNGTDGIQRNRAHERWARFQVLCQDTVIEVLHNKYRTTLTDSIFIANCYSK